MSKRAKAKQLSKDHLKCNKPKKTPSHKTKSHVVKACKDGKEKIIRFGQQGVKGAGKNPKSEKDKAMNDVKNTLAALSIDIAEKIIKKELSKDSSQKKYVDDLIKEINNSK